MINLADLMVKAEKLRKKLGEDSSSPIDIFSLVQNCEKMTIVYYPMGNNLSGMCVKGNDGTGTIAINSTMTIGRQRFSLAHELYHFYYDDSMASVCAKSIGTGREIEKQADAFASFFLMPQLEMESRLEKILTGDHPQLTVEDVIGFEQYFGMSHQATVIRLYQCGLLDDGEKEWLLHKSVRAIAITMGFDDDLYKPLPQEKQYGTYGYYIHQVEELMANGLISDGKYEELLLDAFRDDIVYGTDESGDLID